MTADPPMTLSGTLTAVPWVIAVTICCSRFARSVSGGSQYPGVLVLGAAPVGT